MASLMKTPLQKETSSPPCGETDIFDAGITQVPLQRSASLVSGPAAPEIGLVNAEQCVRGTGASTLFAGENTAIVDCQAHLMKTPPQKETSSPPRGENCYDLEEEQLLDLDPTPVWTPVALDQDEDEFDVKESTVGSAKREWDSTGP